MKIRLTSKHKRGGIALVIVMISIFVLTILAAGFAYSMKVETRLAMHANNESELQWLGRSGVEWAKWILAQQMMISTEPYDSRDQVWAGGPGGMGTSNSPLANLPEEIKLGDGIVKRPRITDLESKWNINTCGELGIYSKTYVLAESTTESELIALLERLNGDPNLHGILVQAPLPRHVREIELRVVDHADSDRLARLPGAECQRAVGQDIIAPLGRRPSGDSVADGHRPAGVDMRPPPRLANRWRPDRSRPWLSECPIWM